MGNIPRSEEEHRLWWSENTTVPYGECWCGCGEKTSLASQTGAGEGIVKGMPRKFVLHHYGIENTIYRQQQIQAYKQRWEEGRPGIPYGYCWCGCGEKTTLSYGTCSTRGFIKGEPTHFLTGHQARKGHERYTIEDRGYETPCWVWQGGRSHYGYGSSCIDGQTQLTHRVFYEMYRGPIPEGLHIDHLCRLAGGPTNCVNPEHLEAVTQAVNVQRSRSARLNRAMVEEMRRLHALGGFSYKEIATMMNVPKETTYKAVTYRTWR